MADFTIQSKTTLTSVDRAADLFLVADASASNAVKNTTVNYALDLTSHPVGIDDVQTMTNKTLTSPTITTPTLTVNDNVLTIQDNSDTTKKLQFQVSGVTTGTTRTLTVPDANDTIVGLAATQTLTNKTLTSPTINNPTLNVDTISEFSAANGVTIDGLNIKDGVITTANSTPAGSIVQVVSDTFSAVATGTTTVPNDDTIPQNTEGTEFMTLAITPKSTSNILIIEAKLYISVSVTAELIAALFQDSTANAIAATAAYVDTGTGRVNLVLTHKMTAGTTSSTTFKVRAGGDVASTTTFNGFSGARKFGAISKSTIFIYEVKA